MNRKERILHRIVDIVVECCRTRISEDGYSVTKEQVLGKCRKANVLMTKCVLIRMVAFAGFSTSTAAQLLNMSEVAVRNLQKSANYFRGASRAYRIAEDEAMQRCQEIEEGL